MDKESRDYREHEYPQLLASLPSHQAEPLAAYVEAVCEERDRNHRLYREQVAISSLWERRQIDGFQAKERHILLNKELTSEVDRLKLEVDRLKRLIEESPKVTLQYGRMSNGERIVENAELGGYTGVNEPSDPDWELVYAVPVAALEQKV